MQLNTGDFLWLCQFTRGKFAYSHLIQQPSYLSSQSQILDLAGISKLDYLFLASKSKVKDGSMQPARSFMRPASTRRPKLYCTLRLILCLCDFWRIPFGPCLGLYSPFKRDHFLALNHHQSGPSAGSFSARTATDQGSQGAISVFLSIPKSSNILSGDDLCSQGRCRVAH